MSGQDNRVSSYGKGVKIANWNEDEFLEEQRTGEFIETQANGELSFMRTEALMKMANSATSLSAATAGVISYGDKIMISSVGAGAGVLSGLPALHAESEVPDAGIAVTTTQSAAGPARRNTFTILPTPAKEYCAQIGDAVKYNENFFLRLDNPTADDECWLYSDTPGFSAPIAHYSKEQGVSLRGSNEGLGHYGCHWKFVAQDPNWRFELEGEAVPCGSPVLIVHAKTNQGLNCLTELKKKEVSEFGIEHEVSCKTKITARKVEVPGNLWTVSNN